MNDISLRSSKNQSFVILAQKVNLPMNRLFMLTPKNTHTKFCAIAATNHQSLVSRESIKKDFLIKNSVANHLLQLLTIFENFFPNVNCVLIFQRLKLVGSNSRVRE